MSESLTQWANNFALGFVGDKPVFAGGKQIGYWKRADDLCKGVIFLYNDAPKNSDPSTWTTKDGMWRDVPVTALCRVMGKAPVWASATDLAKPENNVPVVGFLTARSLPIIGPVLDATSSPNTRKYVIWGAVGLAGAVGLYLVLRRPR